MRFPLIGRYYLIHDLLINGVLVHSLMIMVWQILMQLGLQYIYIYMGIFMSTLKSSQEACMNVRVDDIFRLYNTCKIILSSTVPYLYIYRGLSRVSTVLRGILLLLYCRLRIRFVFDSLNNELTLWIDADDHS